jgi:hypothetical protein
MEATPQSFVDANNPFHILKWVEDNVPAVATTRTVWVKGANWSSFPTGGAGGTLHLKATYLNAAGAWTTADVYSTETISDNTTWTALTTASFTPGRVGPVIYVLSLYRYESATASITVDNALYGPGLVIPAVWKNGDSQLVPVTGRRQPIIGGRVGRR